MILALLIPAAALFGAVALAISAFAKSHKEGQYYLTPLYMIAIPLSLVSLLPGIEYNWQWGLVPIANFSLLFRDLMTVIATDPSGLPTELWVAVGQVVVVTIVYAWLALKWATSNFYREDILFREAEEFDWRFWVSVGPPRLTPTKGQAVLIYIFALILFFFVGQSWQISAFNTLLEDAERGMRELFQAHLMTQALLIAGPAILFTALGKLRWRSVFPIGPPPSVLTFIGTILVAPGLSMLMILLLQILMDLFGVSAETASGPLEQALGNMWIPLAFVFIAVIPGVFEELLFRGYVFRGLMDDDLKSGKRRRADGTLPTPWGAIVASSILFALMHLAAIRIPITFIGGLLLGWIAWRTRSLPMAIWVHILYNSTPLLLGLVLQATAEAEGVAMSTVTIPDVFIGAGAVAFVVGVALIREGTKGLQTRLHDGRASASAT